MLRLRKPKRYVPSVRWRLSAAERAEMKAELLAEIRREMRAEQSGAAQTQEAAEASAPVEKTTKSKSSEG